MPETTPLIKAALNLRVGVGFDVYIGHLHRLRRKCQKEKGKKEKIDIKKTLPIFSFHSENQ